MPGRLDRIESMLRAYLGEALLARCPELMYAVNQILVRFMRTDETLETLWRQVDSVLFNTVYLATDRTMTTILDDGACVRITSEQIRDWSDRLLALAYDRMNVSKTLQDALFDLSREGSYAAMRELVARFPMDEEERAFYMQVLEENGQQR